MLKELFNISRKELTPIIDCFKLLDNYQSGLSKDIAKYIYDGEPISALKSLENLNQDQMSEAGVWFPKYYYSSNSSEKKKKELNKIANSFSLFYSSEVLSDVEICRRWGAVRSLCMNVKERTPHYKADVPEWFEALFLEMTSNRMGSSNANVAKYYSGAWLINIAQSHDLGVKTWFPVLFERIECWGNTSKFLNILVQRIDLIKMLKQLDYQKEVEKLHVTGRVTVAEQLNSYDNLDEMLTLVILLATDSSKQVREKSKVLVSKLEQAQMYEYIKTNFSGYPTARRKELAQLIAVYGSDRSLELLESLAELETSKSVKESITSTIANKNAARNHSNTIISIPEYESQNSEILVPDEWLNKLIQQLAIYLEKTRQGAEDEKRINKEGNHKNKWRQESYERVSRLTVKDLKDGLQTLASGEGRLNPQITVIMNQVKLYSETEFGLGHIVQFMKVQGRNQIRLEWGTFPQWLRCHANELTDLRQLEELLEKNEIEHRLIAQWILGNRWESNFKLPETYDIEIWPFFAENDDYLQEAFGLKENNEKDSRGFELAHGILVVEQFPVIPEQYLQVIYQHALSPGKRYGPLARNAITRYGIVEERVISALPSSKQDERIVAANWIAELTIVNAIPELKKALKKEKRETAKAALLGALHRLGDDISVYISPKALLKEAETGLKKAIPKSLNWFPFSTLPEIKWGNGALVDSKILTWWIVLATKLKQPEGNPLLDLYLEQLDPASKQVLGLFLLQVFISRDILCPNDDQADEYAKANQQGQYNNWQRWAKSEWGAEYKDKTLEDAYLYLFHGKKSEYLGSAIGEKGILSMAAGAKGVDAVQLVTRYMKDHYTRRHQIEAILAAIASNNDPVVIQLLLAVARRHRTNSVQERARLLVEEIAVRNGWSQDELADRTIPTAGLEVNGTQALVYGTRHLTVKLSPDLKIVLENEKGKLLKSLPTARQDDEPELVKQAKKDFSSSKKELKQVIDLQGGRLYEAMCIERQWEFSEWKQYLLVHPIMQHLVQKLVWQLEDGDQKYWVRPTAELELIDIEDDEQEPSEAAKVSVAHLSQLPPDAGKSWLKHFKEDKIKPLFGQFDQPLHQLTNKEENTTLLNYHKGWLTDAFTLRGILTKRGYQRGEAEDGGFFTHYYKDFRALDLRVVIEFSGNCLPEENCTAALYNLAFVGGENRGWLSEDNYKPLHTIPKNLLSEAMLDYEAVAAKSSFDENWEKKVPW